LDRGHAEVAAARVDAQRHGPSCWPPCRGAATSTRWRWRSRDCGPRWAAPSSCRPWSSAATASASTRPRSLEIVEDAHPSQAV